MWNIRYANSSYNDEYSMPNVDPRSLSPDHPDWRCRECGGGGVASTSRGGAYFCSCPDGAAARQRHNESGDCGGCGINGCENEDQRSMMYLEERIKHGPVPGGDSSPAVSTPSFRSKPTVDNRRTRIGPFRINTEGFYRGR